MDTKPNARYAVITSDEAGFWVDPVTDDLDEAIAEARRRSRGVPGFACDVIERAADGNFVPGTDLSTCPECLLPYRSYPAPDYLPPVEGWYEDLCPDCNRSIDRDQGA
jgi:hypothetical protein